MGKIKHFSVPKKLNAVEDYLSGKRSTTQICKDMKINSSSFYEWVRKYKLSGVDGLTHSKKCKFYPISIKLKAVREYLDGKASLSELLSKYGISCNQLLLTWIKKYNGHESFRSCNEEGAKNMTKARKTTFEERIDIVSFCIANNYNYQMVIDKFKVSYNQVYTWVKKYEKYGTESLMDKRGTRKGLEDLSETEKLNIQLKLIEAECNKLKMENDYLKKLEEIERWR